MAVVGLEGSIIGSQSPDATNSEVLPRLWRQFYYRLAEVRHWIESGGLYGVMYWRPEGQRSHPDELQYIAGAPVTSAEDVPNGMVHYEVPATTNAVFTHRGPIGKIGETVRYIDRVWAPASEFKHSGIDIERYDTRNRRDSDNSEMEYWAFVVRKIDSQAAEI
jgi:AraC family transcriptional regulator